MTTNVSRLKELLFDSEQARLGELTRRLELLAMAEQQQRDLLAERLRGEIAALERRAGDLKARLDGLDGRAGSDEALQASVAAILDGAVRDAEKTHHMALTRALSPMVLRTIRTEFERTESEILQALVPHTGRLVREYVTTAMRDLVAQINQRLEAGLKQSPLMLRVRSLMTGRPVAELALAEIAKPEVTDLFLIRRGSGELIARWPAGGELADSDIHMSGILAQINEFAETAFRDGGDRDPIRTFGFGRSTVYLRAAPTTLLAAKVTGPELPGSQGIVDDAFFELAERPGPPQPIEARPLEVKGAPADGPAPAAADSGMRDVAMAPPPSLDSLAATLDQRLAAKHAELAVPSGLGFNPLLALAVLVALPLAVWLAWSVYVSYETLRVRGLAEQVIASSGDLRIYRPEVEATTLGKSIRVSALAPSLAARDMLLQRLRDRLPGTRVDNAMTVLPEGPDIEPRITDVRREISSLEQQVRGEYVRGAVERAVARSRTRLQQVLGDLAGAPLDTIPPRRLAAVEEGRDEARKALAVLGPIGAETTLAALGEATAGMRRAAAALTSVLGDQPAPGIEAAAGPTDPVAAAEAMSAAAERLGAVALLATQALRTPAPEPVKVIERVAAEPSPRARLEAWVRANAVFFSANADYRDPDDVRRRLATLVALAVESSALVRVVGYTDERGGLNRNSPLAKERADKVAADLLALGMPPARVVTVGRPAGVDISPVTGQSSPNRRVEFEVGFIGEGGAAP